MKIARNTLTGLYFAGADFTAPRSGATALPVREGLFVTLWPFPVEVEDTEAVKTGGPVSLPSEAPKVAENRVSEAKSGVLAAGGGAALQTATTTTAASGAGLRLVNPKDARVLDSPFSTDAEAITRLEELIASGKVTGDFGPSILAAAKGLKGRPLSDSQRFWLHTLAVNAPRERKTFNRGTRTGNRWAARRVRL